MIRLLVVDDSPVFRHVVKKHLTAAGGVEVLGEARNGRDALLQAEKLSPDVVTLDMTMPELDGMQTLRKLREKFPSIQVVVLTAANEPEARKTVEALDAGAFDFILKPEIGRGDIGSFFRDELLPRLRAAATSGRKRVVRSLPARRTAAAKSGGHASKERTQGIPTRISGASRPDIVAIGSSTGGPAALHAVLSALPGSFRTPVVVTQHMPKLFLVSLAERLERETALSCRLAEEDAPVLPGNIYLAPGEQHLEILRRGNGLYCHLSDAPPVHHCRPAVDPMFHSLAALAPRIRTLAVVLTGMGEDGAAGAEEIGKAKGHVIAQDEASSVVWGMPGATVARGAAHEVLPLNGIAAAILGRCAVASSKGERHASASV